MLTAVLAGFIGSLFAPFVCRVTRIHAGRLIALIPLGLFAYFLIFIVRMPQDGAITFSYAWAPLLGVNLSFYVDGLSLLFATVISFIGIMVMLYAGSYFGAHEKIASFYAYILFFMASMLGMVLSDNIISLFVFWELTGLSSFLLIGFNHEKEAARKAAWQALLVTGFGGLALLAGLLLLGTAGGSYELSELLNKGSAIKAHRAYTAIFILVSLGAFTKSAQFPFHFWLPDAMEAPTPVSTYLHSATMVKAGVYLLARLWPVLSGTILWHSVVIPVGAVTMLLGAFIAIKQTDLKKILAYSTVSVLGTLVFLLGTGTHAAIEAAMAYVIIHALYKAALFLVAGIVDHETGTRDVEKLSGMGRAMPITAGAALLAGLSMAGLPPLFGFIGKELLYGATLEAPLAADILTAVALSTNALLVVSSAMVGILPFFGLKKEIAHKAHDPGIDMWLGPALLAGLSIGIGLLPNVVAGLWVSPAVSAVTREKIVVELALMHGLTLQLLLSVITFCIGVALFVRRKNLLSVAARFLPYLKWGPSKGYQIVFNGTNTIAHLTTRFLQSGHLHLYILTIVVVVVGVVGFSLTDPGVGIKATAWSDIELHEWVLVLSMMIATGTVVRATSRLFAIISLGVLGYSVVLFYILYGAPDLAMTQFAIDTLTVILLAMVIYRLPRFVRFSTPMERLRDSIPALAAGGLITTLILLTLNASTGSNISSYFRENAYLLAKGKNIVNVILVDFRSLDTMGEVTVLVVAGVGVFSLLKLVMHQNDG